MRWRLAKALDQLSKETRERWPGTTIWTVGDADHAGRPSDHNPDDHDDDPSTPAVVSAVDIVGRAIARAVWDHVRRTRDPRVEYMIFDGLVTGHDHGWQVKTYRGSNPHRTHVHVSVGRGSDSNLTAPHLFDDDSPWGLWPQEDDMPFTDKEVRILKQLCAAVQDRDSNGWFAGIVIDHLRDHPSGGGGISEAQARQVFREEIGDTRLTPGG